MPAPIPVTVLTGFLGAGKTTLLNRILTEQHGRKIAVIENEFGEVGVDNQLVIQSDEEIFEMNNGCICCTVRGDLLRILGRLMKRKDRLDAILIETTGLANPAPVAQTFFTDPEMKEQFRLDAIVTVVDAKHISLHLHDSPEAQKQVAFADVILLNKTDLITRPNSTRSRSASARSTPSRRSTARRTASCRSTACSTSAASTSTAPSRSIRSSSRWSIRSSGPARTSWPPANTRSNSVTATGTAMKATTMRTTTNAAKNAVTITTNSMWSSCR
ncbi:MAG: GTP-binding protein [Lacunisphaera sp.]